MKYFRRIGIKAEICFDLPFDTGDDPGSARLKHAVRQFLEHSVDGEDGFDVPALAGGRCYPDFQVLNISEDEPSPATANLEDYGLLGRVPEGGT